MPHHGPEYYVKKDIKEWLKKRGAYSFMPVQTGLGASTLDFLVCLDGKFIGLEAKAPGKNATARQKLIIQQIWDAGGRAYVIDDAKQLDEVMLTEREKLLRAASGN